MKAPNGKGLWASCLPLPQTECSPRVLPPVSRKAKCSCHFQQLSRESSSKRLRKSRFCSPSKSGVELRGTRPDGGEGAGAWEKRQGGQRRGFSLQRGWECSLCETWKAEALLGPSSEQPGEVRQQAPRHRPEVCSGHREPLPAWRTGREAGMLSRASLHGFPQPRTLT